MGLAALTFVAFCDDVGLSGSVVLNDDETQTIDSVILRQMSDNHIKLKFVMCQLKITVPDTQRVLFRIIAFYIQDGLDRLEIIDDQAPVLSIIKLSGTPRLRTILSQSNTMWMRLIMDKYLGQRDINFRFELSSFDRDIDGT